jgi:methionyl aminopeptidase
MKTLDTILNTLSLLVVEGVTGNDLEKTAEGLVTVLKVEPVFKGYKPKGAKEAYPNILCISINNEVIHGVPDDRKFQDGDVVKIDCGILEDNQIWDAATTVLVGRRDPNDPEKVYGTSVAARKVVKATKEALEAGIKAAVAGATNLSITEAIEAVAKKYDLQPVHGYGGHGIGEGQLHQDPFIANRAADVKGEPFKLESGMRIAIEPMFSTNKGENSVAPNGWTVKTVSGYTAHFERTIVIA